MNNEKICVGSGFLALDIVLNGKIESPIKYFAGGTCGNVISILSFLGWNSYPIARLADNEYSDLLLKDLHQCKVNTNYITRSVDGSTALIIHRIKKNKLGKPIHRFEFKWPKTNKWLPAYKPVLAKNIENYKSISPQIFFFDKINRSSIELAKYYKEQGSFIYFEPSNIKDEKLFLECVNVANVVKYSNERIKSYADLVPKGIADLEIETLGNEGIKYRRRKFTKWKKLKSFELNKIVDTAGAGDWCSAGILNKLAHFDLNNLSDSFVEEALYYGQAIASLSCSFEGARGLMYHTTKNIMERLVKNILDDKKINFNIQEHSTNYIVNKKIIKNFI